MADGLVLEILRGVGHGSNFSGVTAPRGDKASGTEGVDAYFTRKYRELALIAGSLRGPLEQVVPPLTVDAIIEAKFRLAAELRAQYAESAWADTETSWSTAAPVRVGPFEFSYKYQRADLAVRGPIPYPHIEGHCSAKIQQLSYTCSGMAAISSLLQVLAARGLSRIRMLPDRYKETIELMQLYGLTLHLAEAMVDSADVLWLNSACCGSDLGLGTTCRAEFALIVCDTTCSAPQSGRIRRVLAFARRTRTPWCWCAAI